MRLAHFYVLLIWALLPGYIHASRITNNSIKDVGNLTPDSSTAIDQESLKSSKEVPHTSISQLNTNENATSLNQTNQEPTTDQKETMISEEDVGANSFRTDLYKEKLEDPKNDYVPLNDNAINSFAQRISHNVFHFAELNDKGVPGKLESMIWSPFSVYQSLVPLFYAAGGATRKELEELLLAHSINMTTNDDVRLSSSLFLKLSDVNDDAQSGGDKPFSSVTGLFARSSVQLNPDFLQEMQTKVRNVEVKSIDFSDSGNAVKTINTWANESTQGLIKDAVNENQMDQNMFMMIVNCVRFKASWKTRFDKTLTTVKDFRGVNGIQKVQMMKQIGTQKFAKFPIIFSSDEVEVNHANVWHVPFSVLEMPYEEKDLVSLFILPERTENIPETLKYIESVGLSEIRGILDYQDVEVLMPKFKLNSDVNLEEALFESGLKTIFNPATANLTKLVDTNNKNASKDSFNFPPYLSNMIHRTMFETSEEGTAAAAITAMSIVPLTALSHDRVFLFKLDRPFIVLVVKNDDTMVFQGVITDLNGQELDERNEIEKIVSEKGSSSVISKNNLIYPTDIEAKEELTKLIKSAKESQGQQQSSESNNPIEQSQKLDFNEKLGESDQSTDDRSWWIPSRVPEYLNTNNASLNVSVEEIHKTNSSDKVVNETQPTISSSVQPQPSLYIPVDSIQYTKYQQPEPKDPNGIRFPVTRPLNRNKANIKPRYENSEHYKNSLLKWMSVY